ncbi:MAG: hypothetical protein M3R61_03525 [Chloroflexota bacterium]|nr:hypothetical protein [Chloroflexota bacterium]
MIHRTMLRCWAVLMLGLLAACASQPTPASPAPTAAEPTRAPVAPTAAEPTRAPVASTAAAVNAPTTAEPQVTAAIPTSGAAEPGAAATPDSLTPEGYHVLGRPDAPVTLVMYSDFL